ncbi:aspartate/glutamate racemase family protein [Saccharopolyspora sp. ASAGF58]|uniref:aspartate/glutamate racemase family protein n=1 Tax=Saccharopolyspora sp. ASAGF58 TaxID=2719023 RepID=UPI0014402CD4|nr:aspartate/glutamate racemase family protein [Saccharopolyspora sp. ASAGF58]QIZ38841.1 hydantoin racemase [Saccharopolyspora sp. ASAGF58]
MSGLLVLNPNSSASVTEAVAVAARSLVPPEIPLRVDQLDDAPEAIENAAQHAAVAPMVADHVARAVGFDAVLVACHGDPGLDRARAATDAPVVGMGAASLHAAAAIAGRFGVLTPAEGLVERKHAQAARLGLAEQCVAVEVVGGGVLAGVGADPDLTPFIAASRRAADAGAEAVVLGCAGYAGLAGALQDAVSVRVLEPVRAAVGLLLPLCLGGGR